MLEWAVSEHMIIACSKPAALGARMLKMLKVEATSTPHWRHAADAVLEHALLES